MGQSDVTFTFQYNSLNIPKLSILNIYYILFRDLWILGKWGSILSKKRSFFSTLWAPVPTDLRFSTFFFSLKYILPRHKQNHALVFLVSYRFPPPKKFQPPLLTFEREILLATAKQLIRKKFCCSKSQELCWILLFQKSGNFFHRAHVHELKCHRAE